MPAPDPNGADHHTTVQDGLDWQGFRSRFFPERRRHDLEAITAYAAYKRSLVDERSTDGVTRAEDSRDVGTLWGLTRANGYHCVSRASLSALTSLATAPRAAEARC